MHIATLAAHLPMCLWSENCSIRSITCKENAKSLKREVLSCGIFTFGISLSTLQLKFFLPSYKVLYNDLTNYSKVMTKHSKFSSRVVQGGAGAPSHTHSGKAPFIPFPSCRSQIHLLHLLQVLIHTSNGFPPSSSTPFPISDLTLAFLSCRDPALLTFVPLPLYHWLWGIIFVVLVLITGFVPCKRTSLAADRCTAPLCLSRRCMRNRQDY